jgi:hypothetical protein
MSNIRTYNDLVEEKKRLESVLALQKDILHQDFIALKEEFRPALNVLSIVGKVTKLSSTNPLISMAVNMVGGLFLENMVLSGSSKITRLVVPFLAKKVSTFFRAGNGDTILQKIAARWRKVKSNGHKAE